MITLTPDLIGAATLDAGNASARKNGRSVWNEDDLDAASIVSNQLWDVLDHANCGIEPLPLKLKNAPCLDRANLNIEPKPLKRSNHGR